MSRLCTLVAVLCLSAAAFAQQWTPFGYYTQATTYYTSIQQPINADGSSVFPVNKRGVIPVKFTLATGQGDLTIISATDGNAAHAYGGVTFTLPSSPTPLTLNSMQSLVFNGVSFGCGAGSPRFTLDYGNGQYMYIYLGGTTPGDPNSGCENGSGVNLLSDPNATRFEATLLGNSVLYDTMPDIIALYGDLPIVGMWFVTDNGNSQVTLHSVGIASTTYTFASANPSPTCTLPAATIDLQQLAGGVYTSVDESPYVLPADSGNSFRIDSCQYVYNLKSPSTGNYNVFVNIGGADVKSSPGVFQMK